MKLKILVWNMNFWKSSKKEESCDFIATVNPDIAILNECAPLRSEYEYAHHVQNNPWGVGVFSQHSLVETPIVASHPEALIMAEVQVSSSSIRAISFYGRIIDGYARTTIHRSLSDLIPYLKTKKEVDWTLLGGDFNASLQFDEVMPAFQGDRAHYLFFERLKNYRLRDCLEKFHSGSIQTLRHSKSDYPWQNDYLFAGEKLYESCTSCNVIDEKELYELSDHNPIIAIFDI